MKEAVFYKKVPFTAEAEAALRAQPEGFARRLMEINADSIRHQMPSFEMLKTSYFTTRNDLLWVREDEKWHCWKRFGSEGWLLIDVHDKEYFQCSPRATFVSSQDKRNYERQQRQRGFDLTTRYRRDYERRVAVAERKLARARLWSDLTAAARKWTGAKPKNNPPRPKI